METLGSFLMLIGGRNVTSVMVRLAKKTGLVKRYG
jgi:hypothetical protein